MMVDVDTVLRGCSACLTVIISDWLSSVAGSSPEDYLSVSASIHPSAAVDISTVLSAPLGYRFELPSAFRIYVDWGYTAVRLIRLRLVTSGILKTCLNRRHNENLANNPAPLRQNLLPVSVNVK